MKRLQILFVFGLLVAAQLPAQSEKQLREIHQFEAARRSATLEKNWPALADLLADDLVYTHSNGKLESKAEHLASLEKTQLAYRKLDLDSVAYQFLSKKIVLATGLARIDATVNGRDLNFSARFTAVYVCRKKRWQLAAWQTTKRL